MDNSTIGVYVMHPFSSFDNPPPAYRPMPFWFWNGKLEVPRLEQQIADMYAKGIGGFFIHARFGLDTPYLSAEWLECVRASVRAAERFGMEVWLYDEANFPSGLSDLKVTANPEFRAKFVDLTEARVCGPCRVNLSTPFGKVLCAKALLCEGGVFTAESIDLTSNIRGNHLVWDVPSGEWQIMVFVLQVLDSANGRVFGVDYMNPRATELFLRTTHEVYAKELGEYFGKTIKGFFVDEPTLLPWHHDISWYGLRSHTRVVTWSSTLAEKLDAEGLPPSEVLPHLFYTIDETSAEKRLAFYRVVCRLYLDSFFKPYREWCDKHNLLLTGHLLLEEGLYCNTIFQSDPVPLLAQMHIPGTDHLGINAECSYGGWNRLPQTMTNIQGEKLVSSVSHLITKSRTLSETFGCAGWGLTLEDMKRITDWQYSIGVNFMCPHALFYTIEGFRKADAPPSHNHNTSWRYYRCYADYVGRLSYILSEGEHVAQIAVLYPLVEFQRLYEIGRENDADRAICDTFDAVCTVLPRIGYDYDIVHPSLLETACIDRGRMLIGGETFEVLVLSADVLDGKTALVIQEFEAAGGRVILTPRFTGDLTQFGSWLKEELSARLCPDVVLSSAGDVLSPVRCLHRRKDGSDIYFLVNTSDLEQEISVSVLGEMALSYYDLESGRTSPVQVATRDGRTDFCCSLPPYGSALFVSVPNSVPAKTKVCKKSLFRIELGDEWDFDLEDPNCLILDKWQFNLSLANNTHCYTYRTLFEVEEIPDTVLLLLDDVEYRNAFMGGMNLSIQVNDRLWSNPEFGTYLDYGFKTLDIKDSLQIGVNKIILTIFHDAWTGEPKLLTSNPRLLGKFEVVDSSALKIRRLSGKVKLGSWTDQGYPFFSGTALYSTSFSLPRDISGKLVRLVIDRVGDMFELLVNGKWVGVRPWKPWSLDISKFVRPGQNSITIKVTNTLQNFLEGVARPSGLLGKVYIEVEE
jgi:hypothetical protein